MQTGDANAVLDREQLRDITMDDEDLMRDIVSALIEDTAQQVGLIETAIRSGDSTGCARLAHYSKGACANVGANRAAGLFRRLEQEAAHSEFAECSRSLAALSEELALLRAESASL